MEKILFHLAFPVHDLSAAKKFYLALGCKAGRESKHSLILNLHGHQIVAQIAEKPLPVQKGIYPRHFGLVFRSLKDWTQLLNRARRKRLRFYQDPRLRYPGTPIEHHTFFLQDPSHNLLEFKCYTHPTAIFGKKGFRKVGDRP